MSRQRATIDFVHAFASAQGVPPLTGDGFQFDARPQPPDGDILIDLPLQDRAPVTRIDPPPARGDLLFQAPAPSPGGRGFAVGMLVIGLAAGFGGGFFVGQHVAPPQPRPSAAEVPRPATEPVAPAQNFTEAPVAERPTNDLPEGRATAPHRAGVRGGDPASGSPGGPDKVRPTISNDPGTLQLASRPSGAQVYVDEVRVGTTPMTMNNVTPGAHRVRMELAGHRPWTTSVNVEAGAQARIGASLE